MFHVSHAERCAVGVADLLVAYGVHKVFGTHRLTHSFAHSLTDGQARLDNASGTVFLPREQLC